MIMIYDLVIKKYPFDYFFGTLDIDKQLLKDMSLWLNESSFWKYKKTDFYEQYEFSFHDVEIPPHLNYFISNTFLQEISKKITNIFKVNFKEHIDIVAHKLVKGQTIRTHNDYISDKKSESHRLLIQMNENWDADNGGFLMLFDNNQEDVSDLIMPELGSIQGFKISPLSHHAVSTVHNKERFTIVYSLYQK